MMISNAERDEGFSSPLEHMTRSDQKPRISHGKIQKVIHDTSKNTYLIILDKKSTDMCQVTNLVSNPTCESTGFRNRILSDIVKKDLSNMDSDMDYDSGLSSTIFFENENTTESVGQNDKNIFSEKSKNGIEITHIKAEPCETTSTNNSGAVFGICTATSDVTVTASNSIAYTTPTAMINPSKHPAARKIILVTPESQLSKQLPVSALLDTDTFESSHENQTVNKLAMNANQSCEASTQLPNMASKNHLLNTPKELVVHVIKTNTQQMPSPALEIPTKPVESICSSNAFIQTTMKNVVTKIAFPCEHKSDVAASAAQKVITCQTIYQNTQTIPQESTTPSPESPLLVSSPKLADGLNTSLTNIQWLRGMKLKDGVKPSNSYNSRGTNMHHPHHWRSLSPADIKQISEEYGFTKRPPFSYMSLIQMALNSKEDKKMTLREICRWIEDTFKYYKHTAKPGWRNSIRHNLSLYNIFVRESSKRHGSYWTVREDCWPREKSPKTVRDPVSTITNALSTMIPVIPNFKPQPILSNLADQQNLKKPRKGPAHILPRPTPMSNCTTYALVPIQNLVQPTTYPQQCVQQISPTVLNPQSHVGEPKMVKPKLSNIAPKPCQAMESVNQLNIVQQAWITAQNFEMDDNETATLLNFSNDIHSKPQTVHKKSRIRPGLPIPTIYSNSQKQNHKKMCKRRTTQTKERDLNDSSDDESDFISKIEGIASPLRDCLDSGYQSKGSVSTSTPFKDLSVSPHLLSPIPGLSPFRNNNFLDGSFLDYLKDSDGKEILVSPDMLSKKYSGLSRTPNSSQWLDCNVIPFLFTPDKNEGIHIEENIPGTSFSKLLNELPMETNVMDEDGTELLTSHTADNFTGLKVHPS